MYFHIADITDASGKATLNGFHVSETLFINASLNGYETTPRTYMTEECPSTQEMTISIPPVFNDCQAMRMTVTWHENQEDLDIHAIETDRNNEEEPCEIYWL